MSLVTTKYKGRKAKKQYSASEQLYDLDGTHSANSVFGKATEKTVEVKGYDGTPGAATINLGGKAKTDDVINVDDDSDDMRALSIMTKEDLIALVCKVKLSALPKGSAPKGKGYRSKASDSEGGHSSSDSSCGSSSSSSEDGSKAKNGTGGG